MHKTARAHFYRVFVILLQLHSKAFISVPFQEYEGLSAQKDDPEERLTEAELQVNEATSAAAAVRFSIPS
jgi:hypothetical protein